MSPDVARIIYFSTYFVLTPMPWGVRRLAPWPIEGRFTVWATAPRLHQQMFVASWLKRINRSCRDSQLMVVSLSMKKPNHFPRHDFQLSVFSFDQKITTCRRNSKKYFFLHHQVTFVDNITKVTSRLSFPSQPVITFLGFDSWTRRTSWMETFHWEKRSNMLKGSQPWAKPCWTHHFPFLSLYLRLY